MEEIKQENVKKDIFENVEFLGEGDAHSNHIPIPKTVGITNAHGLQLFLQEIEHGGQQPLFLHKDFRPHDTASLTKISVESPDLVRVVKYGVKIGLGIAAIYALYRIVKLVV